jgi:hypothetical protein
MPATRVPIAAALTTPASARRMPALLAAIPWAIAVLGPLAMVLIFVQLPPSDEDAWAFPAYTAVATTWLVVGAVVVTRRPDHRVGWLLWLIGFLTVVSLLGQLWAQLSHFLYDDRLPGTVLGLWLSWLFVVALALALVLVPLHFPDGRLPSRRWRVVLLAALVGIAALGIGQIVRPGPIGGYAVANPTGIEGLGGLAQTLSDGGGMLLLLSLPACVAAPVVRFRRGTRNERAQLKWFGSAMGLAAAGLIGATILPQPFGQASYIGMTVALGLVPVAIAIAILRYRLFEIDRLIGRTLAYAIVTAVLAAAFLSTNLALQAVLAGTTGSSTLVVAMSTLVVAGIFQPVRRAVQRVVDRRFNRSRVDGERVVGAFAAHARDQVDLDRLREAVVVAVGDAVAPAGAGMWLRTSR